MPPDDPTPLGDAMTHRFPQQKIPEPEPGSPGPEARERDQRADISQRPSLPEHPRPMAADLEEAAETDADRAGRLVDLSRGKSPARQRGWAVLSGVPAPENVPPLNNPDPQPNDPKPRTPPPEDEPGRRYVPVDLPGQPHAPERA